MFNKNEVVPFNSLEKSVEIFVRDNEGFKKELFQKIENVVISIIEQIVLGNLPKISYKLPSLETLMDQIENFDSKYVNDEINHYDDDEDDNDDEIFEISISDQDESIPNNQDSGYTDFFSEDSLKDEVENFPVSRAVSMSARKSQPTFILMMKILDKIQELLMKSQTLTRRGFFYELKGDTRMSRLISSQNQIDKIVNVVASILEFPPWELPLIASAKGLCSGDLKIKFPNEELINYNTSTGNLIPSSISSAFDFRTRAEFVLVVEKDSVFQKFLQVNIPNSLNCLLVTGKGYPDLATRILVKILHEELKLPVYILVDADPYGIEIMLTYKFGSINLSFENSSVSCREARWIGLHPSELGCLGIERISLTDADFSKVDSLRLRPYVNERISHELQILRQGKAEIEAICTDPSQGPDYLTSFIRNKIKTGDFV